MTGAVDAMTLPPLRSRTGGPAPDGSRLRRVLRFGCATLACALGANIVTGAPLLALWVGAQQQSTTTLRLQTVVIVLVVLVLAEGVLYAALVRVGAAYERLAGVRRPRREPPWRRGFRDERDADADAKQPLTAVERVLAALVVLVLVAAEIWFVFFAGSPLPNG